ncbi:hypothetical protein B0A48_08858 [Cryoendolithus antarcticus]|uniref:COP9 signalosome complex subunit 4 n=1 Tax=Cryoendolithus antarcticus TaxID=1507870 RepID=A0A1V8T4J1_9PEZI|nr:hypothetical protein B0A48_08858 [Cryoendolithus antarcticus]
MATSGNVASQLHKLETSSQSPQQRAEAYTNILHSIITSFTDDDLSASLVAYVDSILSDSIGVIHSRPLLSTFLERFATLSNETKIAAGSEILEILAPRTVSYEQQDTTLKFLLADAHEEDEDFGSSAKVLQVITLDSSQRAVSDDEKAKVWMRICRCYLEDGDSTNATTYLNRVKQVIFNVTDAETRLFFALSQARISDSMRNFLDASAAYYTLSNESSIDEEERLHTLRQAITTAVLAPAGPQRARQLGRLYKDERASETPEYSILEKIFLDRLLSPSEVRTFAAELKDHQLAKTADGSTVLDKAVLEHNLLAVSRLYQNISLPSLGALLGVDADRAEEYAAGMVESGRLGGSIDQIEGVIHFGAVKGDSAGGERTAGGSSAWDVNVQGLAEEVERVTTLLQREEPAWYEVQVAA